MSFSEHNHNGLIFDTSDVLSAVPGAVHAFTTRHGGVSPAPFDSLNFADNRGDRSENLLENYRLLGEAVGIDASRAVGCRQIHSDLVRVACEEDAGKILWNDRPYDADGLITNVPNLPLFHRRSACRLARHGGRHRAQGRGVDDELLRRRPLHAARRHRPEHRQVLL